MADKIRGITVQLSADVTKVLDGLNKVQKNLNQTTKDLKDVDKALKLDPKNVELLKQKQELLTKAIGETEDKLSTLKEAQAKAAEEAANGNEQAKKSYDLLTREISSCQVSLEKLKNEAEATDKALHQPMQSLKDGFKTAGENIQKAGDKVSAFGDKISDVGAKVSVASAAVVALGAAAVEAFNEVDQGADTVIKKTGATGLQAELLNETYEKLATTMVTTFDDAAAAVGEINTRWGYTGDRLEEVSALFIKFASVTDQDVESAIIAVDHAMNMFNIDGSEMANVLGILTSVGQRTGISVQTLQSSLQTNGATLMEMGLSLAESVELMGMLEQSGADANTVLASMKKAASECSKEGKNFGATLKDLTTRLQNEKTQADALTETYEIFGTRAGLAFVNLAKQGKLNLDSLDGDLSKYADTVETTYEATLDGVDQITITTNKTKVALGKLGNTISDGLVPVLNKLNKLIDKVTKYINGLNDEEKEQVIEIGLIVAAAGPAIVIAGKVVSAIGSVIKVIGSLTSGIGAIANPLTITIAAVVALGIAVGVAVDEMEDAELAAGGWDSEARNLNETLKDQAKELKEINEARKDETDSIVEETGKVEALFAQLEKIVDRNGKIKQGYEEQAEVISEKLAYYLGMEIDIVDGQVVKWKELGETIKDVIAQKKISLLLDANEEEYLDALVKKDEAYKNLQTTQKAYTDQLDYVRQKQEAFLQKQNQLLEEGTLYTQMGQIEVGELEAEYLTAKEALDNLFDSYKTAQDIYEEYATTITIYENALKASTEGTVDEMEKAVEKLVALANTGEGEWAAFAYSLSNNLSEGIEKLKPLVNAFKNNFTGPISNMLTALENQIVGMAGAYTQNNSNSGPSSITTNVVLDGKVIASSTNKYLGTGVGYWIAQK